MVGYNNEEKQLTATQYMVAGSTSGIITRFLCQPLDVIKIRFQLQVEPIRSGKENSKYKSNLQAARTIFKEEGIRGLWKGHNPGQILSILYGIGQFGSFEKLTEISSKNFNLQRSSLLHFVCGSLSGIVGTVVSYPFDVIRTRFIAQGNNLVYKSMYGGVVNMLKNEGPSALFKGMSPALIQVGPHAGAQFGFYAIFSDLIKKIPLTLGEDSRLNFSGSMLSGSLAGLAAKTCVYPFDLMRKRLELQGFQNARIGYGENFWCQGLVNCIVKTYTNEGIQGMFKGLSPSILKAGATSALHFSVYEQTCRAISVYSSSKQR